ncbi:MAG: heavy metal transporter [Microbacteriaceae bacterium]|jgi:copper chaperone|nr:heavy metal transporter [Microbacteriaceae bacterium]
MCSPTTGNDLGLTDRDHDCSCGTDSHAETATVISQDAIREHYLVDGMTCSHCVSSVTEEVSAIDGVESVKVALNAGGTSRIMVVSSKPIDTEAIRGAVTEAGYSLVSA